MSDSTTIPVIDGIGFPGNGSDQDLRAGRLDLFTKPTWAMLFGLRAVDQGRTSAEEADDRIHQQLLAAKRFAIAHDVDMGEVFFSEHDCYTCGAPVVTAWDWRYERCVLLETTGHGPWELPKPLRPGYATFTGHGEWSTHDCRSSGAGAEA